MKYIIESNVRFHLLSDTSKTQDYVYGKIIVSDERIILAEDVAKHLTVKRYSKNSIVFLYGDMVVAKVTTMYSGKHLLSGVGVMPNKISFGAIDNNPLLRYLQSTFKHGFVSYDTTGKVIEPLSNDPVLDHILGKYESIEKSRCIFTDRTSVPFQFKHNGVMLVVEIEGITSGIGVLSPQDKALDEVKTFKNLLDMAPALNVLKRGFKNIVMSYRDQDGKDIRRNYELTDEEFKMMVDKATTVIRRRNELMLEISRYCSIVSVDNYRPTSRYINCL